MMTSDDPEFRVEPPAPQIWQGLPVTRTPTEPTTEAGRRLASELISEDLYVTDDILAIEAEARKIGDVERVLLFEAGMAEARATAPLDRERLLRAAAKAASRQPPERDEPVTPDWFYDLFSKHTKRELIGVLHAQTVAANEAARPSVEVLAEALFIEDGLPDDWTATSEVGKTAWRRKAERILARLTTEGERS